MREREKAGKLARMRTSEINQYEHVVEDYEDHLHKLEKVVGALKRRSKVLDSDLHDGAGFGGQKKIQENNYDEARGDDVDYYEAYVNNEGQPHDDATADPFRSYAYSRSNKSPATSHTFSKSEQRDGELPALVKKLTSSDVRDPLNVLLASAHNFSENIDVYAGQLNGLENSHSHSHTHSHSQGSSKSKYQKEREFNLNMFEGAHSAAAGGSGSG